MNPNPEPDPDDYEYLHHVPNGQQAAHYVCQLCGACLVLSPHVWFDALQAHDAWHTRNPPQEDE